MRESTKRIYYLKQGILKHPVEEDELRRTLCHRFSVFLGIKYAVLINTVISKESEDIPSNIIHEFIVEIDEIKPYIQNMSDTQVNAYITQFFYNYIDKLLIIHYPKCSEELAKSIIDNYSRRLNYKIYGSSSVGLQSILKRVEKKDILQHIMKEFFVSIETTKKSIDKTPIHKVKALLNKIFEHKLSDCVKFYKNQVSKFGMNVISEENSSYFDNILKDESSPDIFLDIMGAIKRTLNSKEKEMLSMFIEGKSLQKIALTIGKTYDAVRMQFLRVLRKINDELKDDK